MTRRCTTPSSAMTIGSWSTRTSGASRQARTHSSNCDVLTTTSGSTGIPRASKPSGEPHSPGCPRVRSKTNVGRTEYYFDPKAPKANTLIPASNLLVTNEDGAILLQRRRDTRQWALPGGAQDIGE